MLERYTQRFQLCKSIAECFTEQALKTPKNIALQYLDQQLSYEQLEKDSSKLANYLRTQGIQYQDSVGILLDPGFDVIIAILACLKLGVCYIPIDPASPQYRLDLIIANSQMSRIITNTIYEKKFENSKIILLTISEFENWKETHHSINKIHTPTIQSDLAYIIYTSGSTGNPKGVMISHHNLLSLFDASLSVYQFNDNDIWTLFHSIAFDFSVWEIWGALLFGAKLIITPPELKNDINSFYQLLIDEEVTILNVTPRMFETLISIDQLFSETNQINKPCHALKYIIFGGDALHVKKLEPWLVRYGDHQPILMNMYGITEITIHATYKRIFASDLESNHTSPIGKTLPLQFGYVLNEALKPVEIGEIGELYIGGDRLALGYLNLKELTDERFIQNPFGQGKIYKSGDLVKLLTNNEYDYIGRSDNQVKIRGYRIELDDISSHISKYPNILSNTVIAKESGDGNQQLIAYCVLKDNADQNIRQSIYEFLKKKIPEYMIPQIYIILDALPLTINGKVDKTLLLNPKRQDHLLKTKYHSAKTKIEKKLRVLFQSALSIKKIGIDDNFFSLGGHSLILIELFKNIRKEFGINLDFFSVYENPTITNIAKLIDKSKRFNKKQDHILPQSGNQFFLGYNQLALWILQQFEKIGNAYDVNCIFEITGDFNEEILERALNQLAQRQTALLTQFIELPDGPAQIISQEKPIILEKPKLNSFENLSLNKLIDIELQKILGDAINITDSLLFKAYVLKISPSDWIVAFKFHHSIFDFQSIEIFESELSEHYNAIIHKKNVNLNPLKFRYQDYCNWQHKTLTGNRLKKLEKFWNNELFNSNKILNLPLDFIRGNTRTYQGAIENFLISKNQWGIVKKFISQLQISPFVMMLSVFLMILRRYSNETDILVAGPVLQRQNEGSELLIGYFTNTVIFRNTVNDNMSFVDFLSSVSKSTQRALKHQDYPFLKLVEASNNLPQNCNPLAQVMLVVTKTPENKLNFLNTKSNRINLHNSTSKFDFIVFINELDNCASISIEFNSKLFKNSTISAFGNHFITLLENVCKNPNQFTATFDMLSTTEREHLLLSSQSSKAPYLHDQSIMDEINTQSHKIPTHIAIEFNDTKITYQQLNLLSNDIALKLQTHGLTKGDIACIFTPPSIEMVVYLIAILKCGAAYLPIDMKTPRLRIEYILQNSKPKLIICDQSLTHQLPALDLPIHVIEPLSHDFKDRDLLPSIEIPIQQSDPAYIIYTSGSTGTPKGVLLMHQTLTNLIQWQMKELPGNHRVGLFASISFDVATQSIFFALCSGNGLIIIPEECRYDIIFFANYLHQMKISILMIPPVVLANMAALPKSHHRFPFLKVIIVAGDILHITESIREFFIINSDCQLMNQYGPSESHVVTALTLSEDPKTWPERPSIGRAIDNAEVYLLDSHLNLVPTGLIGEIYIGGIMLAREYINHPELTASRFIPNPFASSTSKRLYRTGDLARRCENGEIEFIGRSDRQIQLHGYRIELDEIESQIEAINDVQHAVTILHKNANNQEALAAFILPKSGITLDVASIKEALREKLPSYMIPKYICIVSHFEKLVSGKIDRNRLPLDLLEKSRPQSTIVPAKTEIEIHLLTIWQQLLKINDISMTDNFFEIGGNSVLATQLLLLIYKEFQISVPVYEFFNSPTINTLAKILSPKKEFLEIVALNETIQNDTHLSPTIVPITSKNTSEVSPKNILITGANGFLGIHLIHQLLLNSSATLFCLIRGNSDIEIANRLRDSLDYYGLYQDSLNHRLVPIRGDLSLPKLGISQEIYEKLTSSIDCIFHNGAFVHHIYDYQMLRASNVLSTIELLKFASTRKSKIINYISTIAAINDRDSDGKYLEQFPTHTIFTGGNGYTQTKWVSERLLGEAKARGFRVNLFRPSYILGDQTSGTIDYKNNHICRFIKGCIQLQSAPIDFGLFDFLPVDFVAHAIVKTALQFPNRSIAYNINSVEPIPWNTIFSWITHFGYPLSLISYDTWRDVHLSSIDDSNELYPLLPIYLSGNTKGEQEDQLVVNTEMRTALQKIHISYPELDQSLFITYLEFLKSWIESTD